MSPGTTLWLTDVFLIVFGQWSSMEQTNKIYQALIQTQYLLVCYICCWFVFERGIFFHYKKNITKRLSCHTAQYIKQGDKLHMHEVWSMQEYIQTSNLGLKLMIIFVI